jgi:hemoglobin
MMRGSLLVALLLCANAGARRTDATAADMSGLYQLFGAKPGIVALVDDFAQRMLKDERVRGRFDADHIDHFKSMVVDQICQTLGGPCVYRGKDMVAAHVGMHITDAEYDALTDDMIAALDARHIPKAAQRRFLALRDRSRDEIVEAKAARPPALPRETDDVILQRAQDLHDVAHLLRRADDAREQGNAAAAARLFAAAALLVGGEALAELNPLFPAAAHTQMPTCDCSHRAPATKRH